MSVSIRILFGEQMNHTIGLKPSNHAMQHFSQTKARQGLPTTIFFEQRYWFLFILYTNMTLILSNISYYYVLSFLFGFSLFVIL